jgi:hypothetical protein
MPPKTKQPTDRMPSKQQRAEALNEPVTFDFDGEQWTVVPADATSLAFLAALEDEQIIRALRLLLGEEQAARLIDGRRVDDLEAFFETMGEATGSGNL